MSIELVCSECHQLIRARFDQIGQWLTCAVCAGPIRIPAQSTATTPALRTPSQPSRARRRSWKRLLLGSVLGLVLFALLLGAARATWNLFAPPKVPQRMIPLQDPPVAGGGPILHRPPPSPVAVAPLQKLITTPQELTAVSLTPGPSSASLSPVARIDRCLTFTGPSGGDRFLTTTPAGKLLLYRGSAFEPAGSWQLPAPAYLAVLDAKRGRLYAAVSVPSSLILGPLGDPDYANGDLQVFDVADILAGKARTGTTLRPVEQLPLKANVASLILSPDGKSLYYIAETGREAHAARLDALRWKREQLLPLRFGGNRLALCPAGKALYLLSGSRVQCLDPLTLKTTASLLLAASPSVLVAGRDGIVYLADRRQFSEILVLDTSKRQVIARWQSGMRHRCYLERSADGRQLLLTRSAVVDGELRTLSLAAGNAQLPKVSAAATSSSRLLLRGPAFFSPCGRFVVSSTGQVFRLPSS